MLEVCRRRLSSGIPGACHCPDLSSLTFHPAPPTPTLLTWVAAAAVSKSLQSCLTLCDPIDTRLLCPWDSPCKNTGVGCHFLLQCMKEKSQSEVAQSCLTLSKPTRLLHPWDFPGKSTEMGCHCLLQTWVRHCLFQASLLKYTTSQPQEMWHSAPTI